MRFKSNNEKLIKNCINKLENKRQNKLTKIERPKEKKPSNLSELMSKATTRGIIYETTKNPPRKQLQNVCKENSAKLYVQEVNKVIEQSDVVIEVIDARDPIGSRSREIESLVLAKGSSKRLVILLNKIDLVPPLVMKEWLKYLRTELPTIPFKASTQGQSSQLGRFDDFFALGDQELKQSKCSGADLLLRLLGNYCRCKDIRTKITVGVVGYPNTGKSSVINSLKRKRVCNIGPLAGVTRSLQTVQLTKYLQLIDSPGIIFKSPQDNPLKAVLANCVCPQQINDPLSVAMEIINLAPQEEMIRVYGISGITDPDEFLTEIAKRKGCIKQGGIPNLEGAARVLIKDWNSGRILHYVPVTAAFPSNHLSHIDAKIVEQMSKEFDIDALFSFDEDVIDSWNVSNDVEMD